MNTEFQLIGITLASTDLHAMRDFYSAVFAIDFLTSEISGITMYRGSLTELDLLLCPNEVAGVVAEQNRHQLKFEVTDIDEVVRCVLTHGGTIVGELVEQDGVRACAIRDPDGNSIEFLEVRK